MTWTGTIPRSGVGETADVARRLNRLRRFAWLLDAAVRLPGTNFRFGVDAVIGLAPGIGDAAMAATSLYIVYEAARLGVPKAKLARMIANIGVETAVGAVPVLGDMFDAAFKANLRNIAIIEEHFGPPPLRR
jgi:Domain of unknown function (DUF4112)